MTTDRNWQHWHDEIADMPEFDESTLSWYDAETGLKYDQHVNYIPARPRKAPGKHNDNVLNDRAVAKFFGGAPLQGSFRQVKWAETIRAEKIKSMKEEQAIVVCDPTSIMRHAKSWIENRDKSSTDIFEFAATCKSLLNKYNEAKENEDAALAAEIASQYNALTAKWGFE